MEWLLRLHPEAFLDYLQIEKFVNSQTTIPIHEKLYIGIIVPLPTRRQSATSAACICGIDSSVDSSLKTEIASGLRTDWVLLKNDCS